jgi:hypothetical protein
MKIILLLAVGVGVAGLAGVEYLHHRSDSHGFDALICAAPHVKSNAASELYRQHLFSHR